MELQGSGSEAVRPSPTPAALPSEATSIRVSTGAQRPGRPRLQWLLWVPVLVAVAVVYTPILLELARDWVRDPNYSHGFLIPIVSLFLVWRQRESLAALPRRPSHLGLPGILGACSMLVLGAAGSEVFTQRVSLLVLLASGCVFLLGWRWLGKLAFPIAFLFLAIPLPYLIYYSLTSPMQAFAAKCAVLGLKAIGIPVVAQGNVLHLPGTSLEVAQACSGIRSLYSFLALGALLAYSMSASLALRALVFLATIPLSIAGNAFRVAMTSIGVYLVGPQVAQGWIHEAFGMVVFVVALAVFFLLRKGATLWRSAS